VSHLTGLLKGGKTSPKVPPLPTGRILSPNAVLFDSGCQTRYRKLIADSGLGVADLARLGLSCRTVALFPNLASPVATSRPFSATLAFLVADFR
jgi:hypothetical protein